MVHVFDATNPENVPYRTSDSGKTFNVITNICSGEVETTAGRLLTSGSNMVHQISCRANTQNVGNYYSWAALAINGAVEYSSIVNSICPRGWVAPGASSGKKGYNYLIRNAYGYVGNNDSAVIRFLPISLIRPGIYNYSSGSLGYRGADDSYMNYWTNSRYYYFRAGRAKATFENTDSKNGYSLRCGGKIVIFGEFGGFFMGSETKKRLIARFGSTDWDRTSDLGLMSPTL